MEKNFPKIWLAVCAAATIVGLAQGQFGPCYGTTGVFNVPDPADCTRFFICVNGQEFANQCTEGLIFDVISGQCNRVEDSVCIVDVPTIPTAAPGATTVGPTAPGPVDPTPAPVDPTPGPGETTVAPSEDPEVTTVPIPTAPVETTTAGPIPTAPTEPGTAAPGPEVTPAPPGPTDVPTAPTPGPAPTTQAPTAPTPAPAPVTTTAAPITTTVAPTTVPPAPTPEPTTAAPVTTTVAPPVTTTVAPPPPVTTTVAPPPPVTTTVAPPITTVAPPPPGPAPTCNVWDDFYAPHPDCTRFFRCVFGTLHVLNCPPNQFWNQARLYCDHQWNVVCPASG